MQNVKLLTDLLSLKEVRGIEVDDIALLPIRRQILEGKMFLRAIYKESYQHFIDSIEPSGPVLEIGAGVGFFKDFLPAVITSDVVYTPGLSTVLDAHALPFATGSLTTIVMLNAFHHFSSPVRFLSESARCVKRGGILQMIEPWVTPWSSWVYGNLHYEPFDPQVGQWSFPHSGYLSSANGALAWIVFERDRERFTREFPQWVIEDIQLMRPFTYILSGGFTYRSLAPGWSYSILRGLEKLIVRWSRQTAMFASISLRRK